MFTVLLPRGASMTRSAADHVHIGRPRHPPLGAASRIAPPQEASLVVSQLDLSAGGINEPDYASGYRQPAHFSQVVKPHRVAALSRLGDRISRLVVRRLAEPPPKMGAEYPPGPRSEAARRPDYPGAFCRN